MNTRQSPRIRACSKFPNGQNSSVSETEPCVGKELSRAEARLRRPESMGTDDDILNFCTF